MDSKKTTSERQFLTLKGGIIPSMLIGVVLFVASAFQQVGLGYTTAGKAGFITGLYLLSVNEDLTIAFGDLLVLIAAVFWACHILTIDKFAKPLDPLKLSSIQFATTAVLSAIAAIILSMESVFGALGGALMLGERMDMREWIGCALILAGVLISQTVFLSKPVIAKVLEK